VPGQFDLQLSGHVHRGQIFPFNLLVRLSYPLPTGLTRIAGGGWLYVSRGTGTWGPPLRVLAPPEITLIELRPGAT
jgi:predicted MPP superfamily phosphohydrolase